MLPLRLKRLTSDAQTTYSLILHNASLTSQSNPPASSTALPASVKLSRIEAIENASLPWQASIMPQATA